MSNTNRGPSKAYSARTARPSTPLSPQRATGDDQPTTRDNLPPPLSTAMMRSVSMSAVTIITEAPMEIPLETPLEPAPCQHALMRAGTRSTPIMAISTLAAAGSGTKTPRNAPDSNMKETCILLPGSAYEEPQCYAGICPEDMDPSTVLVLNTVTAMGRGPPPYRPSSLRSTGGSSGTARPSSQLIYTGSSFRSSLQRFSNKSSLDGREGVAELSIPESPTYSTSFPGGRGEDNSHRTLPPIATSPATTLQRRAYSFGDVGLCAPASPLSPALNLSPGPHSALSGNRLGTPTLTMTIDGQLRRSCQRLSAPTASSPASTHLNPRGRKREPPQGLSLSGRMPGMDRTSSHQFSSRMDRASSVLDLLLGILPCEGGGGGGSGSSSTLLRLRRLRRGTAAAAAGGGAGQPAPRLLASHQGAAEHERVEVESFLRHMEELRRENHTLKATLHSQTRSLEELRSMRLQLQQLQHQLSLQKLQLQEPVARVSAAAGSELALPAAEPAAPVGMPRKLWECMWGCHKASCKV